ncbi:MAG: hypothetical protein M1133_15485 [Armatimonadetes bacterium]|nr:hypothetical protein [Armatimonadota bacterium]
MLILFTDGHTKVFHTTYFPQTRSSQDINFDGNDSQAWWNFYYGANPNASQKARHCQ